MSLLDLEEGLGLMRLPPETTSDLSVVVETETRRRSEFTTQRGLTLVKLLPRPRPHLPPRTDQEGQRKALSQPTNEKTLDETIERPRTLEQALSQHRRAFANISTASFPANAILKIHRESSTRKFLSCHPVLKLPISPTPSPNQITSHGDRGRAQGSRQRCHCREEL